MCESSPCPDIVTAILAKLTEIPASPFVRSVGGHRRRLGVGQAEALAVLLGRHAEAANEGAAQVVDGGKAAAPGHDLHRRLRLLEQAARRVDADALDEIAGVSPVSSVKACDGSCARSAGAPASAGTSSRPVEMFLHPFMGSPNGGLGRGLRQQMVLNCDWPAGRASIERRRARDQRWRQAAAEIGLDQAERHVDAGGDAGRGPDVAVDARRCGRRRR